MVVLAIPHGLQGSYFPDQGSNLGPRSEKAPSKPLYHQGIPNLCFFKTPASSPSLNCMLRNVCVKGSEDGCSQLLKAGRVSFNPEPQQKKQLCNTECVPW